MWSKPTPSFSNVGALFLKMLLFFCPPFPFLALRFCRCFQHHRHLTNIVIGCVIDIIVLVRCANIVLLNLPHFHSLIIPQKENQFLVLPHFGALFNQSHPFSGTTSFLGQALVLRRALLLSMSYLGRHSHLVIHPH